MLLPNNEAGQRRPLEAAVVSDQAYFVRLAPDVVAVDADCAHGVDEVSGSVAAIMRVWGGEPVVVASGGPGRAHAFCRVEDDSTAHDLAADLGGLECSECQTRWDVRRDIRPPLTPHRLGSTASTLISPANPAEVLVALSSSRRPLSGLARRNVLHGWGLDAEDENASDRLFALAMSAANRRWGQDDVIALISTPGTYINQLWERRCDDRGTDRASAWFRRHVWPAAVARIRASPPRSGSDVGLSGTVRAAACARWSGTGGATDRRVLLAVLGRARELGKIELDLSVRDVAEIAGVTRSTAATSLGRLAANGWIVRMENGSPRHHAATYLLVLRTLIESSSMPGIEVISEDLWRRSGLGPNAGRIHALLGVPMDAGELAAATGLHITTVRRNLKRLREHGLVIGELCGRFQKSGRVLADVARDLPCAGAGERQAALHARERQGYALQRQRLEEKRRFR
jgi:DNA-binding MarR family transcriptional regulator